MLTAHIDDSGSQGEGPAFILAGYVANTEQWKHFSDEWRLALDFPPKLKVVKIQHALRLEEGWGRFKPQQRDELMKRFASIIHRHVGMGIVVSSGWDDLRRIRSEFFTKGNFYPYAILFHGLMSTLASEMHRLNINEKVDFVFDEQGALGRMAVQQFESIYCDIPPDLTKLVGGRPIHCNDEEVLPLQAAHTIAWLHRRYAHDHNITTGDLGAWKPTQAYLKKLKQIGTLYGWFPYERLAGYFSQAQKELAARA